MQTKTIHLKDAKPGDIGLVKGQFAAAGFFGGEANQGGNVLVEIRDINTILRDKRLAEFSPEEEFTPFQVIKAKDAVIYSTGDPEEYLTKGCFIVRVLKKETDYVYILAPDLTENATASDSNLRIPAEDILIPVLGNNLIDWVAKLREIEAEKWRKDKVEVEKKKLKTPKAPKEKKERATKGPSRRQLIFDLIAGGVTDDAELVKLVHKQFPDQTEKNILTAIMVSKWQLKTGKNLKKVSK